MDEQASETEAEPAVPVYFRVTKKWKRKRGDHGPTSADSRNVSLSEALDLVMGELDDDACQLAYDDMVTTITIDWSRVPAEVRNPFGFGVRR